MNPNKIYDSNNRDITDIVTDTKNLIQELDERGEDISVGYAEFENLLYEHGYDDDPMDILCEAEL